MSLPAYKNDQAKNKNTQPLNPDVTHAAMWQVNNFLNQEVAAYDNYNADLERQVRAQEWRAGAWEERAQVYRRQLDDNYDALARGRAGGETVVQAIDNMYNLFVEMCRETPEIGRYHEMLQRIVLHAEAGRRMMQPMIDLTDEEDDAGMATLIEGYDAHLARRQERQVIDLTEEEERETEQMDV